MQYNGKTRLCEEFQRTQRGEVARRQRVELMLVQEQVGREWERKAKQDAQIVMEQERKTKEQERDAKEFALLKIKKMEEKIILSLKKSGKSDEEIAQWLESSK